MGQRAANMSTSCLPTPVTSLKARTSMNGAIQPRLTLSSASAEQYKRDWPWKYEGYKAFSAWIASEDDFFVFRRFGALNANTILWMQDRISQTEEKFE